MYDGKLVILLLGIPLSSPAKRTTYGPRTVHEVVSQTVIHTARKAPPSLGSRDPLKRSVSCEVVQLGMNCNDVVLVVIVRKDCSMC